MNESRLFHAVTSALLSSASAAWAWFGQHGQTIAILVAIASGYYSIRASRSTIKANRAKTEQLSRLSVLLFLAIVLTPGCVIGQPTNQAWLNADRIVTGNLRAYVSGTNWATASDGWSLVRSGNKLKFVNVSSGTTYTPGNGISIAGSTIAFTPSSFTGIIPYGNLGSGGAGSGNNVLLDNNTWFNTSSLSVNNATTAGTAGSAVTAGSATTAGSADSARVANYLINGSTTSNLTVRIDLSGSPFSVVDTTTATVPLSISPGGNISMQPNGATILSYNVISDSFFIGRSSCNALYTSPTVTEVRPPDNSSMVTLKNTGVDFTKTVNVQGGVITNGALVWIVTNNVLNVNYPNGSVGTRTDTGLLYVLQAGTWTSK